ncbi:MAG: ABC transporter permease, partial [Gemmatimonadaceae bacterium]
MMRRLFQWPWRSRHIIEDDVDEEFRFHLDARTAELIARGVPPEEARTRVTREFGDLDEARRYIRQIDGRAESERRRRLFLDDLQQDITFAIRKLRTAPTFAITAILTLAIGIGANTAIFSFVNGVLFRPLPFPRAEQLYKVWSANPSAGLDRAAVSAVDLDDWRAQRSSIADMGGYFYAAGSSGVDYTGAGEPQRLTTLFFTPGFFPTLGASPHAGRLPRDDEAVRGGADRVVMLSHEFFQRQFGGAEGVVGSHLTLGGEPYEVLGVMGPEFRFPAPGVDVFVPMSTIPDHAIPRLRPVRILDVIARAPAGTSELQLTNEMHAITTRLADTYPEDAAWSGATVQPLREAMTGDVRTALFVLFGAVAFVLLISC